MRRTLVISILASLTAIFVACGEEQPEAAPIDTTPIVGVMEVPIAFRNDGSAPTDALRIEANQRELRVESVPVFALERGRIPAAEITPEGPTKLRTAIQGAPSRSRAAITFHGMVGYGTLARTVQVLTASGYREIAIAVRPITTGSPPPNVSWLTMSQPQVAPGGQAPLDPAAYGGATRPWSDFQPHWETAYTACRAGRYVDCDTVPLAFAEGGFLQVVLFARGQQMVVRFNRVGGQAVFSVRAEVATSEDSAITGMVRPVCGAEVCQTVIEADEETPIMRVLSLYGAAFPNGSTAPQVIFRLPD